MTKDAVHTKTAKDGSDRQRQQKWRDKVPELRRIVEDVSPKMWESAREDQKKSIPDEWRTLLSRMREEVHTSVAKATYNTDISLEA